MKMLGSLMSGRFDSLHNKPQNMREMIEKFQLLTPTNAILHRDIRKSNLRVQITVTTAYIFAFRSYLDPSVGRVGP